MSKKERVRVALNRVEKDRNGNPIPVYKLERFEQSKLSQDLSTGKKIISKVKM